MNYAPGYIGFTFRHNSFVSDGIAYFTRWDRMSDIPVSHCLIVTGEDHCIEAVPDGVVSNYLANYFEEPNCHIFFRKPRLWSVDMGARITEAVELELGKRYDYGAIAAHGLCNTILGRFIDKLTGEVPAELVIKLLEDDDKWFCSELAAYGLKAQPEIGEKGCLVKPTYMINPQELFEDGIVFEAWKRGANG